MKRLLKRKKLLIAIGVVALVAAGASVGAYAYFSGGGSGSGSADVGTAATVELSSGPVGPLHPGGADVPVDVSIHNVGDGNQFVGRISGTVPDSGACLGAWFQIDPVDFNKSLDAGATDSVSTKMRMIESNTNQDACKSKSLVINWTST